MLDFAKAANTLFWQTLSNYGMQPKTLDLPLKAWRFFENDQNFMKFWMEIPWVCTQIWTQFKLAYLYIFFVKAPQYNPNARAPHAHRGNLV